MRSVEVETHCHTNVSKHAYSTILENVRYAAEIGLKGICITDHGPELFDGAPPYYFSNLNLVSKEMYGVRIYKGAEASIMDKNGRIDLSGKALTRSLEWVIASIHLPEFEKDDFASVTSAYLHVMENPYVDVIGHCGRGDWLFDREKVLKKAKETGKIIEINEHSFDSGDESAHRCYEIARRCKALEIPVVISSDAHFAGAIGGYRRAQTLLEEIAYPEKWILNLDFSRFDAYIEARRQRLKKEPVFT